MEITLRRNVTRHDGSAPWTLRALEYDVREPYPAP